MQYHVSKLLTAIVVTMALCQHATANSTMAQLSYIHCQLSAVMVPTDSVAADSAKNERTIVVADMETRTPIRQVLVFLPNRESVRTNYRGEFVLRTDPFSLLRLRHPKYHELKITAAELAHEDTLLLLPRENPLGEVVVYGHRKDEQSKLNALHNQINNQMIEELRALAHKPGVNFDFGELTDFKGRARRKRAERIKRSLEKY